MFEYYKEDKAFLKYINTIMASQYSMIMAIMELCLNHYTRLKSRKINIRRRNKSVSILH